VAGYGVFIEGESGDSPLIDWWRWVAGLGKRYLTQAEFICGIGKGQRRRGFPRWSNYVREREMERHDACVPWHGQPHIFGHAHVINKRAFLHMHDTQG
jgi:hypothetical protein